MVELDYNQAYYALTQERVNQLAIDQQRYIFIECSYICNDQTKREMLKNLYLKSDRNEHYVFKIEFTNSINGNIYIVKKDFYPETLYDYITLSLDDDFYDFYLDNKNNPKYWRIDLRIVWYFKRIDKQTDLYMKWVRDSKYIFSFKKLCEAYTHPVKERYDIRVCCKNVGIIKDNVTNTYLCPDHFCTK